MIRLFLLAVCLALGGCFYAQSGNAFDINQVNTLQAGVSSSQDAVNLLGNPASVTNYNDGTQLLQWIYAYGTSSGKSGASHAAVLFGKDGKMIRVTHFYNQ